MKRVVTVHGINTTGAWQRKVEAVLKPHFECVSIQYPHYRYLGASRLVFNLYCLTIGLAATFALYRWRPPASYIPGVIAIIITLAVARLLASTRRERVLDYFQSQLQKKLVQGERPHVIAHSFGTYLTARALKKWDHTRFDHIVLTGTILHQSFNWQQLNDDNRDAFRKVRNELAKKDWVARLAATAQGTIPDMGYAGLVGFKGDSKYYHHMKGPYEHCKFCCPGLVGSVDNVALKELGHSDHFLTPGHAASFWLPFFFGIEPCEYQVWLDLCGDAADAEQNESLYSPRLGQYETWLRTTPWAWSEGTLEDKIRSQVMNMVSKLGVHKSSSELADLETSAIRLIWKEVGEATRAKKQWMDARADPDEGNFLARVWHLFKKDSGESLKLQTGVPEDYQGARTIEDRILSLNPKRAVLYVVTKMFT